ncbi:NAD(P)/FAD-dependent oxidoreductase [Luteimonas sp. FXH3W]|uniref:NAD(P)/FAD-dependent oxidoreductase n=1 Tax=Aquilutibacter rugosus TaxID=3115820 RepID=A0ABU7UWC4_9GAMM
MSSPEFQYDVIVIGGGAAGLFCAAQAGQRGLRAIVLEHSNKVGKKILMSGGGRCNFTNTGASPANYIGANKHFHKSALARYTPWHFIELVSQHGIAYHEKELGQLFCDESSKLIVAMLLSECEKGGVPIRTHCAVNDVTHDSNGFTVRTSQGDFRAPQLVCATGGLSIPSMGASGFGYQLATQFGHALQPRRAGLVPLTLSGLPLQQFEGLAGVALPVEARANNVSFTNAMLITHRGVSGPSILQISNYWQPGDALTLDLLPGQDAQALLQTAREQQLNAELRTVLSQWLPARLAVRLCELHFGQKPMRQLQHADYTRIANHLHAYPLIASGTEGYRTAEVTLGGVDTDSVSSQTMMSNHIEGLYFIGEVLDVTGWLGGYNFQWAWASAHAAASALSPA